MLYMTTDKRHIVVLETANLAELQKGHPAVTPDREVFICWTPDPVWLADKIIETTGDGEAIVKLIEEAAKRPQKPSNRSTHEPYLKTFLKTKNEPGEPKPKYQRTFMTNEILSLRKAIKAEILNFGRHLQDKPEPVSISDLNHMRVLEELEQWADQ